MHLQRPQPQPYCAHAKWVRDLAASLSKLECEQVDSITSLSPSPCYLALFSPLYACIHPYLLGQNHISLWLRESHVNHSCWIHLNIGHLLSLSLSPVSWSVMLSFALHATIFSSSPSNQQDPSWIVKASRMYKYLTNNNVFFIILVSSCCFLFLLFTLYCLQSTGNNQANIYPEGWFTLSVIESTAHHLVHLLPMKQLYNDSDSSSGRTSWLKPCSWWLETLIHGECLRSYISLWKW